MFLDTTTEKAINIPEKANLLIRTRYRYRLELSLFNIAGDGIEDKRQDD